MPCTGKQILKQFFGIFFGIPKHYLKFSDLKPPLDLTPHTCTEGRMTFEGQYDIISFIMFY